MSNSISIPNYSAFLRGAIASNYPDTNNTTAQDPSVSAGTETGIPTGKSSALSALIARNQTPKLSADIPVANNKPTLKSSTDIPIPIDFINSHDDLLQDAIERAVREGGGSPCAYKAFARDDIFKMVGEVQKETGVPMSESDIVDLMKNYNNIVDVKDIGKGVDGQKQKDIIEHFVNQIKPPVVSDVVKQYAQEMGVDPELLAELVKQDPRLSQPANPDRVKALAEQLKSSQVDPSQYLSSKEFQQAIDNAARETGVDKDQLLKVATDICNQTHLPLSSSNIENIALDLAAGKDPGATTERFINVQLNSLAHF